MRKTIVGGVCAALVTGLLVATSAPAFAAANPKAGCMGIGSSGNAGYPRDRAVISHEVKAFADAFGLTPGAIISVSAATHAGSITGCFGDG
ncbi:MAG: hypothetical protein QOI95_342 [Acidimicrobiaceae bacterium]|jgi:hypothetical protein